MLIFRIKLIKPNRILLNIVNIPQPIDIQDYRKSDDGLELVWGHLKKQFNEVILYYVITCKGEDKTEVSYVEAGELPQQAKTNVTSTCSGLDFDKVKEVKLEFITKLGGGPSSKTSFVG